MKSKLKCVVVLASLSLALLAGLPGLATAQQAVLYEIVENMTFAVEVDVPAAPKPVLIYRVSNWTAQGTAVAGSPFCGPASTTGCTITAFGMDKFLVQRCDLAFVYCELAIGTGGVNDTVWANIAAVVNNDNVVDGPEGVALTGQITGKITIFPPTGGIVVPDLNKNKKVLGPGLPLIYVTDGKFFLDGSPTIRTSPPAVLPAGAGSATFESTFRLPFKVAKDGARAKPERGKNAYYLADDGSLIKVDKQDEFALGFPLLRAEVYFTTP